MANDLNSCSFTGRLGSDPQSRETQGGWVTNFSIAVGRKTKQGDITLWLRCSCFGKSAEIARQYLRKGQQVAVNGRLNCQEYEKDGQRRQSLELLLSDFTMIGGRAEERNGGAAPPPESAYPADYDDEIPF